jgi:hypothetical protein
MYPLKKRDSSIIADANVVAGGAQPSSSSRQQAPQVLRPVMRPTTPKSPVFEDMEGSDEEDHVLQNEDEQNYSINEEMGIDGDGSENMIMDADAMVGDGMVRLACGNNLLRSEPTMLRQRLKEDEPVVKVKSPTAAKIAAEKTAADLRRTHSIPGDIHGMHAPDPVAADILRKEPEQETFVRLSVTPIGTCSLTFILFASRLLNVFSRSCARKSHARTHL